MKLLLVTLFTVTLLLSPSHQDELQAVEATYDGKSGGVFYFVDIEGSSYAFNDIENNALEKFDLTDARFEGRKFMVVYRIVYNIEKDKEQQYEEQAGTGQKEIVEQEDDKDDENEGDVYGECIIVDLELCG